VRVAGVLAGEGAGFLHMKGVTEALAAALRAPLDVRAADEPFLHPGRSARLGQHGVLGELHPLVAEAYGIDATVSLFEIDLDELRGEEAPVFHDILTYPPVRQDIAVIVGAEVPAGDVLAHIRDSGGDLLASCEVFDVYEGPQVGEGRKSLAVHLVFQTPERTLTDDDADAAREQIVAALAERFGATLRG
jgi:phenylalanyl-tRNA synthetase beta chain